MSKFKVLLLVNIFILLVLYLCGIITGANFNPFNWSEGVRIIISLFYGATALMANAIIGIEYKPEKL